MATKRNDDAYSDLDTRTQESYNTRKGEKTFLGVLRTDITVPTWTAGKGEHKGNIIPYFAGLNDPRVRTLRMKEGGVTYLLDHYVHQRIGPRDLHFLCLEANYREPCPICEERNRLRKEGPPEIESLVKAYEDRVEFMRPKRRVMYNWECLDSQEEIDKGVQVFEIAHWFMEAKLLEQAKQPKEEGGALLNFSHPVHGKTLWFNRTGVGLTDTNYVGHRFLSKREPLPQDLLGQVFTLDELIYVPTYKEVEDAFWDKTPKPDEEPAARADATHAAPKDEEAPPRRRSRTAPEPEPSEEEEPTRSTPFEVEDDAPAPRRRSRSYGGEEQEPAAASVEDSPPPRRRSQAADPAPAARSGRPKPVPVVDLAFEPEEPTCPIPGAKFGQDGDQFDGTYPRGCGDCPHWNPCVKASVQLARQQGV